MDREQLKKIAQETMQITKDGYYEVNGKRISLNTEISGHAFDDVVVLSPRKLEKIMEDEEDFFDKSFGGYAHCEFYLAPCDSFEAASGFDHPLVMNFANAIYPGGGFLNGARAQEESLCRCSTLYASLSSKKASEMYTYNALHKDPLYSDYMLLSPHVTVVRDQQLNLLEEPFETAVMTIPAPNKNGRAGKVAQSVIDDAMKERLRKFFWAAARNGYSELVLGAWGCGAFGHDTKRVAQYFYELFFEENFNEFFSVVCFAILNDDAKCDSFKEVFGDNIEDCREEKTFVQSMLPMPICNHSQEVSDENIGYAEGVTVEGMPFQAELWTREDSRTVSFVIPDIEEFHLREEQQEQEPLHEGNTTGYHKQDLWVDCGVLTIGMLIQDEEGEEIDVVKVVSYLEETKLIVFNSLLMNGSAATYIDMEGNGVIRIMITLEENGNIYATTPLHFMDFPDRPNDTKIHIVK